MECKESKSLLSAYVDNELDASTAIRLALHLQDCAGCTNDYRHLRSLRTAIAEQGTRYRAPEPLRAQIRNIPARETAGGRRLARLPWTWINLGFAAASSLAFAVTLALYLAAPSATDQLDQEILASHFRSLIGNRVADVASSDQHVVKPWFSGKLDFSPPVHDLAPQGFPLIGGRVDYVNGRAVAALAYRHRQHVIDLFIWPDAGKVEAPAAPMSRQGYQLLPWTQAGMRFWAVSDLNARELMDFKRLLAAEMARDGQ
jgi:anti-sigma factor RsiW